MSQKMMKALQDEIARLARKEIRSETSTTKKAAAQYRRDIAELKRLVSALDRRLSTLESLEKKRLKKQPAEAMAENARFSPVWLRKHREKLGLSAADYGKLVGVSAGTIYNWENEKSKPRKAQLVSFVEIRGLGKRAARRRLDLLEA